MGMCLSGTARGVCEVARLLGGFGLSGHRLSVSSSFLTVTMVSSEKQIRIIDILISNQK